MSTLLDDITAYLAATKMKPSVFGFEAANDGKFVKRIANGGRCWPETEAKVRAYMAANPPSVSAAAGQDAA